MPAKKKVTATKPRPAAKPGSRLDFPALVDAIRQVHEQSAAAVSRIVNTTLTLRNWVIGWYIREYEQNGSDRAKYGEGLLNALAERLSGLNVSNSNRRQLYRYLRFFQLYPGIVGTLSPQLRLLPGLPNESPPQLPKGDPGIAGIVSPLLGAPAEHLINHLSYSHLELIVDLEDPLKRAFYEIECIRENWSLLLLETTDGEAQTRTFNPKAIPNV